MKSYQIKIGKSSDRKEGRSANIGFAKWRVQYFYDSLVVGSSSVFQMNICAENPPLRQAWEYSYSYFKLKFFLSFKGTSII